MFSSLILMWLEYFLCLILLWSKDIIMNKSHSLEFTEICFMALHMVNLGNVSCAFENNIYIVLAAVFHISQLGQVVLLCYTEFLCLH